jgi:hypothetical protein
MADPRWRRIVLMAVSYPHLALQRSVLLSVRFPGRWRFERE